MHPVHKRVVLLNMPAVAGVDPDAATLPLFAVNVAAVWITARLAVLLLVLSSAVSVLPAHCMGCISPAAYPCLTSTRHMRQLPAIDKRWW
jgi:hypothetical protein